jgi:tetratricopeptide (TPR) repeat protein
VNRSVISELQQNPHRAVRSVLSMCALSLVLLASGCSTMAVGGEAGKNSVDALLKDADSELAAGQHDKAINVLNYAAKEHPTSAMPWLKMANIWFEKGNYPSAILASSEVLKRDAGNQEAKSLLVVAGLRVAASAVTELRPTSSVNMGTRVEAENLTNSLRSALGEKVLVPAAESKSSNASNRPRVKVASPARSTTATAAVAAGETAAAVVKQTAPGAGSPDPFKSLK